MVSLFLCMLVVPVVLLWCVSHRTRNPLVAWALLYVPATTSSWILPRSIPRSSPDQAPDPPQIHARTKFISFFSATSFILQGEPQEESQVTQHEKLVDDVQKEAHGEEQADLTRSEFVASKDQRTAVAAQNNHERGC